MDDPRADGALPPGASPRSGLPPPVHTRWKKGQSGNPGGRPKGESVTATLRRLIEQDHNGRPIREILAERFLREALTGKFVFLKELVDRVDGRATEHHEVRVSPLEQVLEMAGALSEDDIITLAVRVGSVDLLPPRMRMIAERRRDEEGDRHG